MNATWRKESRMEDSAKKSVLYAHSLSVSCSFYLSVEVYFINNLSNSKTVV